MFKQQRKATLYIPRQQLERFRRKLQQAGYEDHDGLKVPRPGEVLALRAPFIGRDGLRQNHVQVVDRGDVFAVYAHTEPHTLRLVDHAFSAVGDWANFSAGSRMLRKALRAFGFSVKTYSQARATGRRR